MGTQLDIEVEALKRELAAYKRGKAENDERYMLERDEARHRLQLMTERAIRAEHERDEALARAAEAEYSANSSGT